jgi:hypothetical protein
MIWELVCSRECSNCFFRRNAAFAAVGSRQYCCLKVFRDQSYRSYWRRRISARWCLARPFGFAGAFRACSTSRAGRAVAGWLSWAHPSSPARRRTIPYPSQPCLSYYLRDGLVGRSVAWCGRWAGGASGLSDSGLAGLRGDRDPSRTGCMKWALV